MNLFKNLKETVRKSRLKQRAAGWENIKCQNCNGTGYIGESWEDEYGSYHHERCRYCFLGSIKVKIDSARQKLAMKQLMRELDE